MPRANSLEIREQYEKQLKDLQEAYGEAMLELRARKSSRPSWSGASHAAPFFRAQWRAGNDPDAPWGLLADGIKVPLAKLCAWFGVPRRTVYYKPTKATPKVDARFAESIRALIEKESSFGYRTVAWLLGFNKNTVQSTRPGHRLPHPLVAGMAEAVRRSRGVAAVASHLNYQHTRAGDYDRQPCVVIIFKWFQF